jgi:hypothetical protein
MLEVASGENTNKYSKLNDKYIMPALNSNKILLHNLNNFLDII